MIILSFHWLALFPSLEDLMVISSGVSSVSNSVDFAIHHDHGDSMIEDSESDVELQLENLCLTGICFGDYGLNWLWRSCRKLKRLMLRNCEGIGDSHTSTTFINCLKGVQEVELRTCRTVVDGLLLRLAENCLYLNSLLVYDGGSREGLLQFTSQSRCNLRKIDLRLPIDLDNHHLTAIVENFRGLLSLRLCRVVVLLFRRGLRLLGLQWGMGLKNCFGQLRCGRERTWSPYNLGAEFEAAEEIRIVL